MLRIRPECIPCIFSTGIRIAKMATCDPELHRLAVSEMARRLSRITWNEVPLELSYIVQRIIEEITRIHDPYQEIKHKSNRIFLDKYEDLKSLVAGAADPLEAAVRLAIAGNDIDFGSYTVMDFKQPVKKAFKNLAIDDYTEFRQAVMKSRSLIYFLDNAGEIVLDKLLIETMNDIKKRSNQFNEISFVVRESPVLNDVTLNDVIEVGLTDLQNVSVMSVGDGGGDAPSFRGDEIRRRINKYDLVIFKGQANFEIFEDMSRSFFLLTVKCPLVAGILGVEVGSMILKYSR